MAEVIEPKLKEAFCKRISGSIESLIREVERTGRIPDIDAFTSLIYYGSILQERYACPATSPKTKIYAKIIKHLKERT